MKNPFRYFKTSPEIIRLAVMMYVRFPLSLCNVEDLLHERGIEVSHETVRFWWNWFGPIFAADIRKKRMDRVRSTAPPRAPSGVGSWRPNSLSPVENSDLRTFL